MVVSVMPRSYISWAAAATMRCRVASPLAVSRFSVTADTLPYFGLDTPFFPRQDGSRNPFLVWKGTDHGAQRQDRTRHRRDPGHRRGDRPAAGVAGRAD